MRGKTIQLKDIEKIAQKLREEGKKIVFTNGCFDLLHVGHVRLLEAAKALGDALVIGLNSDSSVKAIKGEGRPLNKQADRAELLSALACVDYVVIFNERVPIKLAEAIKPDVYVKGGEYDGEIPEAKIVSSYGGKVVFIDMVKGYSTTKMIENTRKLYSFFSSRR